MTDIYIYIYMLAVHACSCLLLRSNCRACITGERYMKVNKAVVATPFLPLIEILASAQPKEHRDPGLKNSAKRDVSASALP